MINFTVRLPAHILRAIEQAAAQEGLDRARWTRRALEEALGEAARPRPGTPGEEELLALLAEKAREGSVGAIKVLLARQEEKDPRARALRAFEQLAEGRRQ